MIFKRGDIVVNIKSKKQYVVLIQIENEVRVMPLDQTVICRTFITDSANIEKIDNLYEMTNEIENLLGVDAVWQLQHWARAAELAAAELVRRDEER